MDNKPTIKIFRCRHCRIRLGVVEGGRLIVGNLRIELRRGLTCDSCEREIVRFEKPDTGADLELKAA